MCKILKNYFPQVKIGFMGRSYTKPVIQACLYVDDFIDMEDFLKKTIYIAGKEPDTILHVFPVASIAKRAKQLKIPLRIGTTNRMYHWITCNKLVRFSRKKSNLHEAQLNLKLLKPFRIDHSFSLEEIASSFGLEKLQPLEDRFSSLIKKNKYNLILHPKSQGNAREWGIKNFMQLIGSLDTDKYEIFVSGTEKEKEELKPIFETAGGKVTDIVNIMPLAQFVSFISQCDGLVANSTGPLHIAAALGKDALGIYPPLRPIHPQRWKPVGAKAKTFVLDQVCFDCKGKNVFCHCITEVNPQWIKQELDSRLKKD
jgi:ADP-heptose:LPS heptosyltransferase